MRKVWSIISPKKEDGFSVVEVLLAATVFGFLVTGLAGAIIYGRSSTASAGDHQRAAMLADEGIEATRNIANAAYSNLVDGSYGLVQSAGQWTLSGTSDTSGIYTRQVVVATAGTNRKTITSTVTWPLPGNTTGTVSATTRIVNWEANIKLWSNAIVAGSVNPATAGVKVATQGNYAYEVLSATTNNFVIVNISNPAAPSITSTTTFTNTPTNIFVSGNYAYVTTGTNTTSLEIIDITNPAAPVLKSSVSMTAAVAARGVFVSGSYAYVVRAASATAGANEFTVVNISNPLAPTVAGGYNNDIQMNKVYVSGNFAYVATSSTTQEMLVINITTPATPTLAATYNPTTPNIAGLTITGFGNTVLLGMSTTLDAVNITTPTTPTRLGTFTAAGVIQDIGVDITNQFAFLGTASTTGEFQVVNITNLAAMVLSKTVDVTGTTSTVNGVGYNSSLDVVAGSSISTTQRFLTFSRN
jgi:Tfp pilus assembly protein PilV